MRHVLFAAFVALVFLPSASAGEPGAAVGGLRLEIAVEPTPSVVAGEPVRLHATFVNEGAKAVRFYVPEHVPAVTFPAWRLVRSDGAAFAPYDSPFQSMWQEGLQGEIATLEPGAKRTFTHEESLFVAAADRGGLAEASPLPLPPGTYAVRCAYEKADDQVPFGEEAFVQVRRKTPGLWTGSVTAKETALTVAPSPLPALRIDAPEVATPGEPYEVAVTLSNPGATPLALRGAFLLRVHSKMYGGGAARIRLDDGCTALAGSETYALAVGPGETRTWTVDATALTYHQHRGWRVLARGLFEVVPEGLFVLDLRFEDAPGTSALDSNSFFRRVAGRPAERPTSLRLELTAVEGGPATRVHVALVNRGDRPVRTLKRLAYPADVYFSIADATGARRGVHSVTTGASSDPDSLLGGNEPGEEGLVPDPHSWDGGKFERAAGLAASDFTTLEPGQSTGRDVDLVPLVDGGLPPGRYKVRAYWRNREDGRRLDREAGPAWVGRLASETLAVEATPR